MKQSGVQNLVYLVESHGDNMHTSLPLETLNQATINTQVVDGFTVKATSSHRDSMHYLSIMTRLLRASYCNKTIVSCRRDSLPCSHIRDDLVSLMTFSEFNNASSKTKVLCTIYRFSNANDICDGIKNSLESESTSCHLI
jgi:crossover junction endonuclease MUS81